MPDSTDEQFMREALALAQDAAGRGEVPVGAVVVLDGKVIAKAANQPISTSDPTAHAEILAIRQAAAAVGNYRLTGSTLYCTLEPCVMCAGALVHARIARLVFGARDLRFGGIRSKFRLGDSELLNHRCVIEEGPLSADCTRLMEDFFRARRT